MKIKNLENYVKRNHKNVVWYSSVSVACCYATNYYGTAEWRIRRNSKGEYVAYSSGASKGNYPYLGSASRYYSQMGCAAKKLSLEEAAEIIRSAKTGKGIWAEHYGARIQKEN